MNKGRVLLHNDLILMQIQNLQVYKRSKLRLYKLSTAVLSKPFEERPEYSDKYLSELRKSALEDIERFDRKIKELSLQMI